MLILAVDIGTTTLKTALYRQDGTLFCEEERHLTLYTPEAGHREHDPTEVWETFQALMSSALKLAQSEGHEFAAISLSSYMHSLILVDSEGQPLTQCILWNDARASEEAKALQESPLGLEIYRMSGTPLHPMSPLCKLSHFAKTHPALLQKTCKAVSIKEYIVYRLTGRWLCDLSMASGTGLLDQRRLQWSDLALETAGIERSQLSRLVPTTEIVRDWAPEQVRAFGLERSIPLIMGAGDGPLANLGSRGLASGAAICTIGTSAAVRIVSREPILDPEGRTFSYILTEETQVAGGALNNGGIAYDWLRKTLRFSEHLDPLLAPLDSKEQVQLGAGLIFLPYLSGERAPYWDANLRAAFLGLHHEADALDLLMAGLKGICFAIKDVFAVLTATAQEEVQTVYGNGGFVRSRYWRQLLADILELPLVTLKGGGGPLFGAFVLAQLALGQIPSLQAAEQYFQEEERLEPQPSELLRAEFRYYRRAVELNQELCHELARLQADPLNDLLRGQPRLNS